MKVSELFEGKGETAPQASARYEKFKKMLAAEHPGVSQQQVDGIKKIADSLWNDEIKKQSAKHSGDWWELAKTQYPMAQDSGEWVVTSKAKGWTEEKQPGPWRFAYKAQAIEKIDQLVKWLAGGRKKGHGDEETDIDRWVSKIQAA